MTISRIPLAVPDLGGREKEYLCRCVDDSWVSSAGPDVTAFEERIAAIAGTKFAVATASGTAALHLLLCVAGVAAGKRVVVPDWTFAATANAVIAAGAQPVFVDVTPTSWTLDPHALRDAIRQYQPVAVVPVHVLGHPAEMSPILSLAASAGIPVFEDAAGALGARYLDRPVGGLGHAAIFSFNGNKTITTGGGGAIVTDDAELARKAKALSSQARRGRSYHHDAIGFNYRMPNVNAALGLAQLERLDQMLAAKARIAERYDAALVDRSDLVTMPRCNWATTSNWLYAVRCATRADAESLIEHLDSAGIDARTFWEALSPQPPYVGFPAVRTGVANALSGCVVTLPCSSHLTSQDQDRVNKALATWSGTSISQIG
ncbi:MAG: aminotransferase class I/II-fold pyridoxal phosphate-dependent enzyme [Pseudomonadota bacterium]